MSAVYKHCPTLSLIANADVCSVQALSDIVFDC